MNKGLTAINLICWVFLSTQYCCMVSEVKEFGAGEDLKQFKCHHHAFKARYWSWKEMPETKMDAMLKHTCLVQLVKLTQITMA